MLVAGFALPDGRVYTDDSATFLAVKQWAEEEGLELELGVRHGEVADCIDEVGRALMAQRRWEEGRVGRE